MVADVGKQARGTSQPLLATAANLSQSGQILPSGLPAELPVAAGGEGKLPVSAGAVTTSSISSVVTHRPQLELPANGELASEFSNQFSSQLRSEAAAQKLESVLPEGLRFSTTLEQPAVSGTPGAGVAGAGVAGAGLSALAPAPGSTGATTLPDNVGSRPVILMNTPLGEQGWAQEVGSRLQVLAGRGNQRAENYQTLSNSEGQEEAVRVAIKEKIQSIIRRSDSEPGIEEVYFTDFIIQ